MNSISKIKTAVIGVGYLGKYHVEKFHALQQSELIAICDQNIDQCRALAQRTGVNAIANYRDLVGMVDAVSIAAPTALHHEIALFLLENRIHVLVEKPIATTVAQADELIKLAQKNKRVLQVGHLEQFNNAFCAATISVNHPRFIDASRLAPFKPRCLDVDVILDLMIHDIELVQSLVKADISHIEASGATVLSSHIDIANAHIHFANGCVATLTASRVSETAARKMQVFQKDCYINIDFNSKTVVTKQKSQTQEMFPGIAAIESTTQTLPPGDALHDEISAFLDCILQHKTPLVDGKAGRDALHTAIMISDIIKKNNAT